MFPLLALVACFQTQPSAAWALDEIRLANGATLRGLILDDSAAGVRFQVIRQTPGKPTVTLTTFAFRADVAATKKLSEAERDVLREKVAALDPRGTGERGRMEALDLKPAEWLGRPGGAKRYDSDQFAIVSPAAEEVTRRAAVRLEQIFTAYARFLPPRFPVAKPTTVLLAQDQSEFAALLGPAHANLLNPAVFEPRANRIVLRTDLRRLGTELTAARLHNMQQFAALEKYEGDLKKLYRQRSELERHLEPLAKDRKRLNMAEVANDAAFDKATLRPFAVLYHEAFHAYAGNFVYPPAAPTGELPRWLNEGLAQLFETAILEAGELRVGHADPDRLMRAQALAKNGGLLAPGELLALGQDAFLVAHAGQRTNTDRAYLTAWAVAFHLTFEKRLPGTPAFDAFVAAGKGPDAASAFAKLVGRELPDYAQELAEYLARLNADGTLRK